MLMSELADRADVPVATVKYYLREGLLPPGRALGPRRADYDETHVRRLRLLWLLREVGGVPVSALQEIVDAIAGPDLDTHESLCRIADALTPDVGAEPDAASAAVVDRTVSAIGWTGVRDDAAARARLGVLMRLLDSSDWPLTIVPETLLYYAGLVDGLSRTEIGLVDATKDRSSTLEDMVTGERVFGEIFTLLRRMAHEHYHAVGIRPGSPEGAD